MTAPLRAGAATLVAALLALVLLVAAAPRADAAPYTVWSCRGPAGEPVGTTAWQAGGSAGTRADGCAEGGALRAALGPADVDAAAESGFRLLAPAGTTIAGWRAWLDAATPGTTDGTSYAAGLASADALGARGVSTGCLIAPAGCTWGDPDDPLGDAGLATGSGGVPGLAVLAGCATAAGCGAPAGPGAHVALHRSAVDLEDATAPSVGAPAGPLAAGAELTGAQPVVVAVADTGGGVERTELLVDGQVTQVAGAGGSCAVPYDALVPCPATTDRAFVLDLGALAPGAHAVAARAVDAAGNVATGPSTPFRVAAPVATTPAPTPAPVPAPAPAAPAAPTLTLALPARVSLPAKTGPRGQARWSTGRPAAAMRLDVLAGPLGRPASSLRRIGRVRTRSDGSFVLPRSAESRALRVVPSGGGHPEAAAQVDVVAPLRVVLRGPSGIVRNGRAATFRGTVSGAGDAAPDLHVLVQAVVRGRWSTVDAVRPDEDGDVRWRYRFRNTTRPAAYRFRLVVEPARGLPWRRTASPRRVVRVDP
jgi:hypothetical protein